MRIHPLWKAVPAGLITFLLWYGAGYFPLFFVSDPEAVSDFIAQWFLFAMVLPSLLVSGGTSAVIGKEYWRIASVLSGLISGCILLFITMGRGLWWTYPILLFIAASVSLFGGYIAQKAMSYGNK